MIMIIQWLKNLEVYYFKNFDITPTSLVASGNFRDSHKSILLVILINARDSRDAASHSFLQHQGAFSAVLVLPQISLFWTKEAPLVLHRLGASPPGNIFPVIRKYKSFPILSDQFLLSSVLPRPFEDKYKPIPKREVTPEYPMLTAAGIVF